MVESHTSHPSAPEQLLEDVQAKSSFLGYWDSFQ
jgi:hypothetical protein